MFLKKDKDPTSKQLDDDEWIRSLTEAQEVTADVPEDSVMYDHQEVDTPRSSAFADGRVLSEVSLAPTFGAQRRRNCGLPTAMRQLGAGSQGGAEVLAIFHQLLYDEWPLAH